MYTYSTIPILYIIRLCYIIIFQYTRIPVYCSHSIYNPGVHLSNPQVHCVGTLLCSFTVVFGTLLCSFTVLLEHCSALLRSCLEHCSALLRSCWNIALLFLRSGWNIALLFYGPVGTLLCSFTVLFGTML